MPERKKGTGAHSHVPILGLIECPYSLAIQAVGAVYDRPRPFLPPCLAVTLLLMRMPQTVAQSPAAAKPAQRPTQRPIAQFSSVLCDCHTQGPHLTASVDLEKGKSRQRFPRPTSNLGTRSAQAQRSRDAAATFPHPQEPTTASRTSRSQARSTAHGRARGTSRAFPWCTG